MATTSALLLLLASFIAASLLIPAAAFAPPSWEQLRENPALSRPPPPVYENTLPSDVSPTLPILYRDARCVDVASETVWLAMECKNVEYLTVLVSKEEEAVPRIVWPDDGENNSADVVETDPVKLLEQIQARYPDTPPHFYPKLSSAVDAARCNILRLPGVMPRYSEPEFMSRAPYLFRDDGTLVLKASHCVSLEEVEEMQEEYYLGPYLCGRDVTAADMVWAPYLERYAVQLPLMFPTFKTCNPRSNYDEVNAWYVAMERLPAWACCVQGDARHWRKCLEEVIPLHNERAKSEEDKVASLPPVPEMVGWWMRKNPKGDEMMWKHYAESRHWLSDTPAGEVALHLSRNCEELRAAATSNMGIAAEEADEALREVVQALLQPEASEQPSANARQMALFLSETLEVPKDVGMVPALALGELALSLQPQKDLVSKK